MGRRKQKGESGAATNYVSRAQALKKLQLSLKDFRRLCILKGIYPHEPKKKMVAGRGNSTQKTYYYLKDIQFLAHEPIINTFRKLKVFMKKIKKASARNDTEEIARLHEERPTYKLDHVIKERYPTFSDALRDLDDSLSMCMLFATFPKSRVTPSHLTHLCRRLTVEFMNYIIESRSLRKVFISIKGYYFQAEIMGQPITWIVPHHFPFKTSEDVDFKIMVTFTQFYATMLGFINFKLYNQLNLHYPPTLSSSVIGTDASNYASIEELTSERVGALNQSLNRVVQNAIEEAEMDEFPFTDDPEKLRELKEKQARVTKLQKLFEGLNFYIGREVPRETFVFVIRCCGGQVSWDKTLHIGATFDENDPCVTHHIIDRNMVPQKLVNKYYVQPQYVFDCINNCALVPVEKYFPGAILPPHLSPFVEESEGDYVTPDKHTLLQRRTETDNDEIRNEDDEESDEASDDDEEEDEEEDKQVKKNKNKKGKKRRAENEVLIQSKPHNKIARMGVQAGKVVLENKAQKEAEQAAEEKRLAELMIPKKKKRLYEKMKFANRRKKTEVNKLTAKRQAYELNQKTALKNKKNSH